MSFASLKLELLREKNAEKISQIRALGYQSVPISNLTDRQIAIYLAKINETRY